MRTAALEVFREWENYVSMQRTRTHPSGERIRSAIGRRLRELREARGQKQSEWAGLLGLKVSTYSKIELGQVGLRLDDLVVLAEALDIPAAEMLPPDYSRSLTAEELGLVRHARSGDLDELLTQVLKMRANSTAGQAPGKKTKAIHSKTSRKKNPKRPKSS